ncbi:Tectonin beta-propeller repeat-containing protein [Diplonema papillatum]|nr:Tectonin beta-propeller repeat-containing protein [Diplonema papillatum]
MSCLPHPDPVTTASKEVAESFAEEKVQEHEAMEDAQKDDWLAERHTVDEVTGDLIAHTTSYENQRWYPGAGWTSALLPTDRYKWSTKDGKLERKQDQWPIPWVWGHPHHECEWVGDWEIVVSPGTDEKGWAYAFDFKSSFAPEPGKTKCVRRRLWQRIARVKPEPAKQKSKAKDAHSTKIRTIRRLQEYEHTRSSAFEAETTGDKSLRGLLGSAVADTRVSAKILQSVRTNITAVIKHETQLGELLKKSHGTSLSTDPNHPVVGVHAALNAFACKVGDELSTSRTEALTDVLHSIDKLCDTVTDVTTKLTHESKRALKLLTRQHDECAAGIAALRKRLDESPVTSHHAKDFWLDEQAYVDACMKFRSEFESYKAELQAALATVHGLESKCVDMMHVAGSRYAQALQAFGASPPAGGPHQDPAVWMAPTAPLRDVSRVGTRAQVGGLSAMDSELVQKSGPLEMKRLIGWSTYLAVVTADRWLYLIDPPKDGEPVGHPAVGLCLCDSEQMPLPEEGHGCFVMANVTKGFFGHSETTYKFRAGTEEEMVDWMVFLKQRS